MKRLAPVVLACLITISAACALDAAFLPQTVVRAASTIDPNTLGVDAGSFPVGSTITKTHVDWTGAAVDNENVLAFDASESKQGALYQSLRFLDALYQSALLPDDHGAIGSVTILATVFPTQGEAQRAESGDMAFLHNTYGCHQASVRLPVQHATCALLPLPVSKPASTISAFTVKVWVSPSSMPYDAYPTLYAQSIPGASCSASVVYTTGRHPVSFSGYTQALPASGVAHWSWHEETKGSGGTATVNCTYRGQSRSSTATFTVG